MESLKLEDVGKKCTCSIIGKTITDAKIQLCIRRFFICQNIIDGVGPIDKMGYKYSWHVGNGGLHALFASGIRDLKIIKPLPSLEDIDFDDLLL